MDMNKLTIKAQEALGAAQNLALTRGHQEVDAEHLALALLRQQEGLVPGIVKRMGASVELMTAEIEQALDKRPSVSGSGVDQQSIRITQRLARALAQAEELARRLKDEYVSVEHIFAQLVEAGGALGDICRKNGIDLEKFLRATAEVRGGQRVTSADPEGTYEALTKYGRDLVEDAGKG
ncbi:MAG: type VI secretion system ATPase TssH, partial [Mailhella sp.]|nr:type VI secretion system ATPase TssH [Mailhella sp.]